MRQRGQRGREGWLLGGAGLLLGAWLASHLPAAAQVKRAELRPGLVMICRDGPPGGAEITQLEPTIAFALGEGEGLHPRLTARGGTVRWEGYLTILRAGEYQFSAVLRGKLRLTVAGKEVLGAEVRDATPAAVQGPATRLEAGVYALAGEFTRLPGAARVQVWWKSPQFYREPLPSTVFGHLPATAPARLARDRQAERGRFLAEELSCTTCHRPRSDDRLAKGLAVRQGPDLSAVGGRVHVGWLYRWLTMAPHEQPGRVMPRLFADDDAGRTEAYAVARYLGSLGGPIKQGPATLPKQLKASVERGRRLFAVTGCITCHRNPPGGAKRADDHHTNYPLLHVSGKTTPQKLAEYLLDPLAVDPGGRMPHMLLNPKEAADLANFLCSDKGPRQVPALPAAPPQEKARTALRQLDPPAAEYVAFARLTPQQQWIDLGRRLVIERSCASCHTIAPKGQAVGAVPFQAGFAALRETNRHARGCLAPDAAGRGKAPQFSLTEADRAALRVFLKDGSTGPGSPSPAHAARVALRRFNCFACHARDGEGGITPDLVEQLRKYEKVEDAESVLPPPLTGVGHKLRVPWLREVLTAGGRARSWMGLRMPQFGAVHVGKLPEALAALDGAAPEDAPPKAAHTPAVIQAGRQLIGKSGFGCTSCHDIAGTPSAGTRGPDLALVAGRLHYEWYRRWLESAQRMQPGTKMPTVFPDGRSLLDNVLDGNPETQAEAMWAYLALGPTLPLPEGLGPPKGLVLAVKDRPVLVRSFLPDEGKRPIARGVAVGYPGGVSVAFDAAACRAAYAWAGHFLDAAPAWDNRGGAPAKVLGLRFWSAPPGFPWGVSDGPRPPDFAAQARDPAFGTPLPEGELFTGQRRVFFDGYALDREKWPVFRYRLDAGGGKEVKVEERQVPLRGATAVGVGRAFVVDLPAGRTVWFDAGTSDQIPRWLDEKGAAVALAAKGNPVEKSASGRWLILPQSSGPPHVLTLPEIPPGTVWHMRREGTAWRALVRLPPETTAKRVRVRVDVWVPAHADAATLRELRAGR
ncbi:MAG: c-type cytochrome [Gemmataceae bacterium]|nr:c-type cytochrome [Gemmataceae bacterium]